MLNAAMPGPSRSRYRALAAAFVCAAPAAAPAAEPSAVVFVYHRFGEDAHPSTNTRLDQLAAHIEELAGGGYTVLPLADIAAAVRSGRALPDRTVGISIDDAYRSVHDAAWPRFRAAGLPFTLFVATDPIDRGFASYMGWDGLRALAADPLVDIGSQTASHPHMPLLSPARNRAEIEKSNARFAAELGLRPALFAYPYGEASLAARRVVAGSGFAAAFGQHSGAVHRGGDAFYMPRFALNEAYGGMERFRLAANALPLEAMRIVPADPYLAGGPNLRRSPSRCAGPRLPGSTPSPATPRARGARRWRMRGGAGSGCVSPSRSRRAARASTARSRPGTGAGAGSGGSSWFRNRTDRGPAAVRRRAASSA